MFKSLEHSHADFESFHNGQVLESGYKPDCVLRNGNEYIILESENSSSRKTYVGGMIKAAHFLQNDRFGKLVFVIVPKKNTRAATIANHLRPYLIWLGEKTNLRDDYVIEAGKYYNKGRILALDSDCFYSFAFKV